MSSHGNTENTKKAAAAPPADSPSRAIRRTKTPMPEQS
jgi:hypothetical protein